MQPGAESCIPGTHLRPSAGGGGQRRFSIPWERKTSEEGNEILKLVGDGRMAEKAVFIHIDQLQRQLTAGAKAFLVDINCDPVLADRASQSARYMLQDHSELLPPGFSVDDLWD